MTEQKHTHEPVNVDEALSASEAFLIKNKNVLLGAVFALVVVVGGFLAYNHFIAEPKEVKASEAIFKGEQYFGIDQFEIALNGDSLGYAGFVKLADEFSGPDAGNLANAYAGICYAQLGELDKAASTLQDAAKRANSMVLSPVYLIQAGQILEKQGKNEEAVKVYQEIKTQYANSYQAMDIDKYIERASLK